MAATLVDLHLYMMFPKPTWDKYREQKFPKDQIQVFLGTKYERFFQPASIYSSDDSEYQLMYTQVPNLVQIMKDIEKKSLDELPGVTNMYDPRGRYLTTLLRVCNAHYRSRGFDVVAKTVKELHDNILETLNVLPSDHDTVGVIKEFVEVSHNGCYTFEL